MKATLRVVALLLLAFANAATVFGQVDLISKIPSNADELVEIRMHQEQSMKSNLGDLPGGSQDYVSIMQFHFGQRSADEATPVDVAMQALNVKAKIPAPPTGALQDLVFDSKMPNARAKTPTFEPLLQHYRQQSKAKVTLIVAPNGEVFFPPETTPQEVPLEVQQLMGALQTRTQLIQREGVKVGETWETKEEKPLGMSGRLSYTALYKYEGRADKEGKLAKDGTLHKITITASKPEVKMNLPAGGPITSTDVTFKENSGEVLFNAERGRVDSMTHSVHFVAKMKLSIGGMEIDAVVDSKVNTETLMVDDQK